MDNLTDSFHPAQESTGAPQLQSIEQGLAEIDRILHQMLLLAQLSASDAELDRLTLQWELEHLRGKIDRIADQLNPTEK